MKANSRLNTLATLFSRATRGREKLHSARKEYNLLSIIHSRSVWSYSNSTISSSSVFFKSGSVTFRLSRFIFTRSITPLVLVSRDETQGSRKISRQNRFHRFNRNFSRSLILLRILNAAPPLLFSLGLRIPITPAHVSP